MKYILKQAAGVKHELYINDLPNEIELNTMEELIDLIKQYNYSLVINQKMVYDYPKPKETIEGVYEIWIYNGYMD